MSTSPSDHKDLIVVFYDGLINGLITTEDVKEWAYPIIKQEPQPDFSLIELSLSADKNRMLEVMGTISGLEKNSISVRALLGLLYHELFHSRIAIDKAILTLSSLNYDELLTTIERGFIYDLEKRFDHYYPNLESDSLDAIRNDTLDFLLLYKEFSLTNYKSWAVISNRVEAKVATANTVVEKKIKQIVRAKKVSAVTVNLKQIGVLLVILIFLMVITLAPFWDKTNHRSTFEKLITPIIWWSIYLFGAIKTLFRKPPLTKELLRQRYLSARRALSAQSYAQLNINLLQQFQQLDLATVKCIHLFICMKERNEPDTSLITNWLKETHPDITIVYPKTNFRTLAMRSFADDKDLLLAVNEYGITEPVNGNEVMANQVDMVILPLLAFDKNGYRVGYGKGFYDRFAQQCRKDCRFIGLSHFEPVESIDDINEYDVWMHDCLTPVRVWHWR